MVLLSIGVPTYNRAKLLEETINSIVAAMRSASVKDVEVELIISDNASTDDTPHMMAKLKQQYPFIKCLRNEINVVDENFFLLARAATGRYVWIFADDDLMELNAVDIVLGEIRKGYSTLILNYSMWDSSFHNLIKPVRYEYSQDLFIQDKNKVLDQFGTGLQFISSIVIEKNILSKEKEYDYRRLHQYGNSFLYAVYSGISVTCNVKYIATTLLKYRGGNSEVGEVNKWYKYFIYGNNLFLSILRNLEGYSSRSIKNARRKIIKEYLLQDIALRKRNGFNSYKLFRKIPYQYYSHIEFWGVVIPVILMPNRIFTICYNSLKK